MEGGKSKMNYNCNGTVRIECQNCGHYFDFCPISRHRDSVCPNCGGYFVNFFRGLDLKLIKVVPWWYGKPVPGWITVEWEKDEAEKKYYAVIPEFYLDINIHLAVEKGENRTREQAIEFFRKHAKEYWGRELKIVSNDEWNERRKLNPEEVPAIRTLCMGLDRIASNL